MIFSLGKLSVGFNMFSKNTTNQKQDNFQIIQYFDFQITPPVKQSTSQTDNWSPDWIKCFLNQVFLFSDSKILKLFFRLIDVRDGMKHELASQLR